MLCGCSSDSDDNNSQSSQTAHKVENKTISGVSQKGPFVTGSTITVQELDANSLKQTGKSFKGKIENDKGSFAVRSVSLASQYAMLEANGY